MKNTFGTKAGLALLASASLVCAGLFIAPMSAYAAGETDSEGDVIGGIISDVITIQTTGDVSIRVMPSTNGVISSSSHNVIVSTTSAAGYKLQMKSTSGDTKLTNVNVPAKFFTATSGTLAAPAALGINTWGYRLGSMTQLNNASSSAYNFAGVTTTDVQLKSTAAAIMGDTTTVNYAMKSGGVTTAILPAGLYQNEVLYTATAN